MAEKKERSPSVEEPAAKKCQPCSGEEKPFSRGEARTRISRLQGWRLKEGGDAISKTYVMKDFASAVQLIEGIAEVAESEGHHPDIHLTGYRKLAVELSTHSIRGLSENDFILAAKIDTLPKKLKTPS